MALFNQYRPQTSPASTAGILERSSSQFPSPWLDPISHELPTNIEDVLKFSELLWYSNGVYQQALGRMAAYFVTKVKIEDVDDEEKETWENYLNDILHINNFLVHAGRNMLAYGNCFISPLVQISRTLHDPETSHFAPISNWDYEFKNGDFIGRLKADKKGKSNKLKVNDYRPLTSDSVKLKVWNPHTIKTKYNSITDRMIYRHILPKHDADRIRQGDKDYLEDTPMEFIHAALEKCPLRIHNDKIFHMRDIPLAGIDSQGLGVPRSMANFRAAFQTQVIQRLNMVLAMEYSTPLRSITPASNGGELDPTMGVDLGSLTHKLQGLISTWKRDPSAIHTFPVPLQYTAWSGEGLQLVSHQIQEQVMNNLLVGLGIPVDFFTGTIKSERTFVPVLRLLERTWSELVSSYNSLLGWVAETVSATLRWKKPILKLESVTVADDIELRNILFDLYMQGRVSGSTAFETIAKSPVEENRKMLEEQMEMQQDADEHAAKLERGTEGLMISKLYTPMEHAQEGQEGGGGGGQAPGAGAGNPQANNTPQRPEDILEEAQALAEQLLQMPQEERRMQLKELKQTNEVLHSAVRQAMDQMRSHRGTDAAQQGGE